MAYPNNSRELLQRNLKYAKTHEPIRKLTQEDMELIEPVVIISCFDPRIVPEEFLGLARGEAPVIRNAGGRAKSALPEFLVLDAFMKIKELVVVHHEDCGVTHVTEEQLRQVLSERSPEELAKLDTNVCYTDIYQSVRDDIAFLRNNPLVRKETKVTGFVYELETGEMKPVDP